MEREKYSALEAIRKRHIATRKWLENLYLTTDCTRDKIKSLHKHTDADEIPEDDLIFRTSENRKVYAINEETGETSGLGNDIDNENNVRKFKKTKLTHFERKNGVLRITEETKARCGNGAAKIIPCDIADGKVFAGKGGKKPLDLATDFANAYGGEPSKWMHSYGTGKVRVSDGTIYDAEIHWFECEGVGQAKWKVKKFK